MSIRAFRPEDLAQVAALHAEAFGPSRSGDVLPRLRNVFVDSSWQDPEVPSLVFEDRGEVTGFLGVTPRPMQLGDVQLRVAIPSVFMVRPANRGRIGLALVRALMAGRQDLSLTLYANATSEAIGLRMGWSLAPYARFWWFRPLRPLRHTLLEAAEAPGDAGLRRKLQTAVRLASAACAPVDKLLAHRIDNRARAATCGYQESILDGRGVIENVPQIAKGYQIGPVYTEASFDWLMQRIEARSDRRLERVLVHDSRGDLVGWFIYRLNGMCVAEVSQVLAARGRHEQLIHRLLHHAGRRGAIAVRARFDLPFASAMNQHHSFFKREGSPLLLYGRDPKLVNLVLRGHAQISSLEGDVGF